MSVTGTDGGSRHHRMIAAAMDLLEQQPSDLPSVMQIAAAAGVEPEIAQDLFQDSTAVYEAAAEQAMAWLNDACIRATVKVEPEDAVGQFAALGEAYLDWATANESYFRLISDSHKPPLNRSPMQRRYHDALRDLMHKLLERAQASGMLAPDENIPLMVISARSFAYGVARMVVDGRMQDWNPDGVPLETGKAALRDFTYRIAKGSYPASPG